MPVIKIVYFLILFYPVVIFPGDLELLKEAAAEVLLSYSAGKQPEFNFLKSALNYEADNINFEKDYSTTKTAVDSLINHFKIFESELEKISPDSALFLFNQWYLHFSRTFYEYNKEKLFSSGKTKIILFSTSMSCQCTLEMCRSQLIDILKFISQKGGCPCSGKRINIEGYELLVVDAYENNELQIKYETFFSPSVIVIDGDNRVLLKIEYEENMIEQLKNYFRGEI